MSRPHVLHVVLTLAPGGTERLVIDLIERLRPDADASVCCLDDAGEWAGQLTSGGVPVVSLRRRTGFRPLLARRIAAMAARERATVLHCHHYSPFIYGRLATLGRGALPMVFTEHGRLFDRRPSVKRRMVNALATRFAAAFCAVSEELRAHLIAEGFPADRVHVVPNGIEPGPMGSAASRADARRALGIEPDAVVVGTVARLEPVKDLPTLIDAFAGFSSRVAGTELVIIGEGSDRARLDAAARAHGVRARVRLVGARSDARTLLPAFDIFVNSSVTEGVSVTILEAMAAGVPVVATRVGGTPEVIVDGDTGILVGARDPRALADALEAVAAMPDRSRGMIDRARRRVETAFGADRMAARYLELYGGMAEGRA